MTNTGSILTETKKVLGIDESYDIYDSDITMHINAAFVTLNQLGVGPKNTFAIVDKTTKWNQFTDDPVIASVKSYLWASVRLAFDPPSTSFAITALENIKKEFEWRMNVAADRNDDD